MPLSSQGTGGEPNDQIANHNSLFTPILDDVAHYDWLNLPRSNRFLSSKSGRQKYKDSSFLISIVNNSENFPRLTLSTSRSLFSPMAFSATFSQNSFSCLSQLPHNLRRNPLRLPSIRAVKSTEPEKEKTVETKSEESSVSNTQPSTTPPKTPRKPVYSSEFRIFKKNILFFLIL